MIIKGIPLSKGIALGNIKIINNYHSYDKDFLYQKKFFDKEKEIKKFTALISKFNNKFTESEKELLEKKDIFLAFKRLINDSLFIKNIEEKIFNDNLFLEEALEAFINSIKKMANKNDTYFYEKQLDIINLVYDMIHSLNIKKLDDYNINSGDIILLEDISILDIANIVKKGIKSLLLKKSNTMSHTASILSSLKIPSIISLGDFDVKDGDYIIVDGEKGLIFVNPNYDEIEKYSTKNIIVSNFEIKNKASLTKDNIKINILANINFEKELNEENLDYVDGIGLFRTEFLITDNQKKITEEEQFKIYKFLAEKLKSKPLIIRTFDIGSDKNFIFEGEKEKNPSLGNRGIRFLLSNKDFFKVQLKAILRASNFGNVMIMYPFVSILEEVIEANKILDEVKNELKIKKIPFNENIKVGIMLEIPSIILILDKLVKKIDFFSIGTNDMMQYLYARDRLNLKYSSFYQEKHIEFFRLLKIIISNVKGNPLSICGNLAQDKEMLKYLIGLGYRDFSVPISLIPEIKNFLSKLTLDECKKEVEEFIS